MDFDFNNYLHPDKHGFTPDFGMIGDTLTHTGRERQYVITGFAWLGATDEWGYEHRQCGVNGPTITRPLSHLAGARSNGRQRYEEYQEYAHFYLD
jgi:hypothetical protein